MEPTGKEALDGAEARPVPPERPTMRERLHSAIPLAFVFFVIGIFASLAPRFKAMYKEMELGDLPLPTKVWISLFTHPAFPFLFAPFMFAVAFLHFTWVCRTRKRMNLTRWLLILFGLLLLPFLIITLFLPLFGTMERIRGAR